MTVVGKCVHRCTHVLDLEKTLAFYEKALGITETRRKEPEDGSWIIVFASNEKSPFELEFTWNKGVTEPYNNGGKDTHIAFRVPDMEEARISTTKWGAWCTITPPWASTSSRILTAAGLRFCQRKSRKRFGCGSYST